ncbi:hypothetical protein BDV93DRAFT_242156 [Ceratobasidium sp. AG-I]|nr:hypothetical protein BDV93DRAFT_242156 [Ceratobasidium sp. AG-I]
MPNHRTFHRGAHMPCVQPAPPMFIAPAPPRPIRTSILRLFVLGVPHWITKLITTTSESTSNVDFLSAIDRSSWTRFTQMNAVILLSSISRLSTPWSGGLETTLQLIMLGCSVTMVKHGRRACAQSSNTSSSTALVELQAYRRRTGYLLTLQALCLCTKILGFVFPGANLES